MRLSSKAIKMRFSPPFSAPTMRNRISVVADKPRRWKKLAHAIRVRPDGRLNFFPFTPKREIGPGANLVSTLFGA